jgi:phage shock protein PspC (stress-responsive transcriptional regulator)
MQKVITINLNGNAYQIDEGGYAALVAYLEGAERQLTDNPDRVEIIKDLEQAIADKCRGFLGPHKTVVSPEEVDRIIKEMGPVDGATTTDDNPGAGSAPRQAASAASAATDAPRRLYLIEEGSMFGGVCTGIAAYLHVDVTIVRIGFLLLALVTKGGFGLAYLVLAFVIPSANTSEERAAARGQAFNAQELVDRAKKNYADFKDSRDWRGEWRRNRRAWKQQWRASRWQPHWGWSGWGHPPVTIPGGYGSRIAAGVMVPILTLVSVALFWSLLYGIYSLVTRQEVLGQPLPDEVPLWLGIVILAVLYQMVAWPIHLMRRSTYYTLGGAYHGVLATFGGLLSMGFVVAGIWLAYYYVPEVREMIRSLPDVWNSFRFEDLRS